jgi:hypothetical protein
MREMQKTTAAQALLAILVFKNKWENNSRKWELGRNNGKISEFFDSLILSCTVSLTLGWGAL